MGKVATVGELKGAHTTRVASLDHFLGDFCVSVIVYGHHAGSPDFLKNLYFVKFSHDCSNVIG